MSNDLIPHRNAAASTVSSKITPAVKSGISDLLAAFATNLQRDDEVRITLRRLYVETTSVFPEDVVLVALKRLALHNPRNPFHPTPQDVHDACNAEAAQRHRDYLASLGSELRDARDRVIRDGGWGKSEGVLIAEAKQLLADEAALCNRSAETRAIVDGLLKGRDPT